MEKTCEKCRTKKRGDEELRSLKNRLARIEGQVRGVEKMLESDAYCTDILTQVSAINSALCAFSRELLANHMKTCVTEDIKAGKEETVDEVLDIIYKLMK
jgi:DNA-binding FrmR family transcriptional regulator